MNHPARIGNSFFNATSGLVAGVVLAVALGCGTADDGSQFAQDPTPGKADGGKKEGGAVTPPTVAHHDFSEPILDVGVPANAQALFAGAAGVNAGGPCVFEPQMGSLFPNNWLRARFRFNAANSENLFEIKVVVPNEVEPLIIYTTKTTYTLPSTVWGQISSIGVGKSHVSIRSAVVADGKITQGPWLGTTGDIEIAPVSASGSIVYWTSHPEPALKGFSIGDENVREVLKPSQAGTTCVACHTSTPDGKYVGVTETLNGPNQGDGSAAGYVDLRSVDGKATSPPFLTDVAKGLLGRAPQQAPTFTKAHWSTGDRIALTNYRGNRNRYELAWTDLEATSADEGKGWGFLARNGDPNAPGGAQFSRDGSKLVYMSSAAVVAGTFNGGPAEHVYYGSDLYTVPYNDRKGGTATPLPGASEPDYNEYYPSYSSDDGWIAFNRIAKESNNYSAVPAEVFIIPQSGGTPTRLESNDPASCLGMTSPGLTNSWPKWSPEAKTVGAKKYYFLVFSSTRNVASNGPQLYVAPIVVEGANVKSFPALYLWNQPETEHNHTPAWDVIDIPPVIK